MTERVNDKSLAYLLTILPQSVEKNLALDLRDSRNCIAQLEGYREGADEKSKAILEKIGTVEANVARILSNQTEAIKILQRLRKETEDTNSLPVKYLRDLALAAIEVLEGGKDVQPTDG